MALKPTLPDNLELIKRLDRIRKLCDELDVARGAASQQRSLITKMKGEADAMHQSLKLRQND